MTTEAGRVELVVGVDPPATETGTCIADRTVILVVIMDDGAVSRIAGDNGATCLFAK